MITFYVLIKNENGAIKIWIQKDDEIVLWKEFTDTMPISIEYNIFFE